MELTAEREGLVWLMEEAGEEEGGADCYEGRCNVAN